MTRKELLQAMLDGERVVKISWLNPETPIKYIEYDTNTIMTMVYKDGARQPYNETFVNTDEWEIYAEPEWFDNIPAQGVICYVDLDKVDIIYQYNRTSKRFYGLYKDYAFANPMIPSEIELLFITS